MLNVLRERKELRDVYASPAMIHMIEIRNTHRSLMWINSVKLSLWRAFLHKVRLIRDAVLLTIVTLKKRYPCINKNVSVTFHISV